MIILLPQHTAHEESAVELKKMKSNSEFDWMHSMHTDAY